MPLVPFGGYLCARCVASRMDRSHPSSYSARQTLFPGNFSTHFVQQYVTLSVKNDFLRCYLCYLDIPDSESVYFFLLIHAARAQNSGSQYNFDARISRISDDMETHRSRTRQAIFDMNQVA